jgi:hypothetical protein
VASLAASVDRRLAVAAVTYALAFLSLAFLGPEYGFFAMSASNFVLLLNVLVLWARPNEDLGMARQNMERRHQRRRRWLQSRFGGARRDASDSP